MIGSTKQRSRLTKALRASAVALLVLAAGCSTSSIGGDPDISADADRGAGGTLEGLKVKGSKFTPNGEVVITTLLVGDGPNASQYVEETIQADADGKINFERRPMPCPTATGYGSGSWTWVSARDTATGISGGEPLTPGSAPDCTG
ncbi:MAG TPA: hypothetical protein VM388_05645 [Acidimicrobiales bacterium]|nr:hypothetical protein [Acidimicrobiales bacterium]